MGHHGDCRFPTGILAHLNHTPHPTLVLERGVKRNRLVLLSAGTRIQVSVGAGDLCLCCGGGNVEACQCEVGLHIAHQLEKLFPSALLGRRHPGVDPPQLTQIFGFDRAGILGRYCPDLRTGVERTSGCRCRSRDSSSFGGKRRRTLWRRTRRRRRSSDLRRNRLRGRSRGRSCAHGPGDRR